MAFTFTDSFSNFAVLGSQTAVDNNLKLILANGHITFDEAQDLFGSDKDTYSFEDYNENDFMTPGGATGGVVSEAGGSLSIKAPEFTAPS